MRKLSLLTAFVLLLICKAAFSQTARLDEDAFFSAERPFNMVLNSDLKNLFNKKMEKQAQPANVTFRLEDSTVIQENIEIRTRGKFRLENCFMPPILLDFKTPSSPKLRPLGRLKLVTGCAAGNEDEQLIIKEFLAYKIFNMLTDKSFRVRLVNIKYEDTRGKVKSYSQYGFLLEDVDDMAKRNKCLEVEGKVYNTESTLREQMTLVALFEYMIGNYDWSVPGYHNIKLMRPSADQNAIPIAVPYDLNHSGFVNAPYAIPPDDMEIKSVKDRLYRGFPRSMEELESTFAIFRKQKENILNLISNCEWQNNRYKKETTNYIEGFYRTIENKSSVKYIFIDNARKE